ncbi:hypothetical protein DFR72_113253 [Lentzea flaviverrucosa]|uniref:Uncharacterized protein n=1 Tax=Lentzea flaviverrucosa TaxID=200379 RepID=A0A1H9XAS8_9PSEU|nr:hypothetical protein DFR72_113253 [Lentzea flaviverrucosa]SES42997.1 hypothetical protein SAMN05216195_11427 [Lentzea flaviverrucosa]
MDAATAAIISAGVSSTVTGLVALGVGWLNPHMTAKRARETELLKMRRDTYVTALQLASSVFASDFTPDALEQIGLKMRQVVPQLSLLGNDTLANEYAELANLTTAFANGQRDNTPSSEVTQKFVGRLTSFMSNIRAHIGVDQLDR